jgi:hypothetical protein
VSQDSRLDQQLGSVDVAAVVHIRDGHDSGVVVDAVDDPVRAASRTEPIGQRGRQQWICCLTRLS